jgi:two-component system sensor histidine kinase KdpD
MSAGLMGVFPIRLCGAVMKLPRDKAWHPALRYVAAVLLGGLCATLCLPLLGLLDQANIVMLFLLTVAITAAWLGQGPGILAAFLSVALFDLLFVEPRFSLAVHDGQYLVTFAVMLLVALLISHLSSLLQQQLHEAQRREQRTRVLYECARNFAGAITREQVDKTLQTCLSDSVHAERVALYLPDAQEHLEFSDSSSRSAPSIPERLIIQYVYNSGQRLNSSEFAAENFHTVYLAMRGASRMRGVLVLDFPDSKDEHTDDRTYFLEALSSLLATALERLHFVTAAQAAELAIQSERLRSSILSSISHDVRTPLTVLCGLADTLQLTLPGLPAEGREIVESLRAQAFRLHGMVDNLLHMARLQSGKVQLKRDWQPLEEVIGASIHLLGKVLSSHTMQVKVPADLPLVQLDAVLMERVFCNLLENAAKYSSPYSTITLAAAVQGSAVEVRVCNEGEGFPAGAIGDLLDVFSRGQQESPVQGFGLGLSICRSIIEAHGGKIVLTNPVDGGACVVFTLPLGSPPTVEPENASYGMRL